MGRNLHNGRKSNLICRPTNLDLHEKTTGGFERDNACAAIATASACFMDRDAAGDLTLTDSGRAVLRAMLPDL
jgi:hypothetical protein